MLTLLGLVNLGLLGGPMLFLDKTNSPRSESAVHGDDFAELILNAGIIESLEKPSLNLLLLLGKSSVNFEEKMLDDLEKMRSKGINIQITSYDPNHVFRKGTASGQGKAKLQQFDSAIFETLGLSGQSNSLVLYLSGEVLSVLSHSFFWNQEEYEEALLNAALHPFMQAIFEDNAQLSEMLEPDRSGPRFASFAFDSLIANANEIDIELDRLDQNSLIEESGFSGEGTESKGPILSRPWGIQSSPSGEIFICDGEMNQVLVLGGSGKLTAVIGKYGQGPGEFQSPHSTFPYKDGLLIADLSYKLHKFNRFFKFEQSFQLDAGIQFSSGIARIDDVLFLPTHAMPPSNTKLINIVDIEDQRLRSIGSFFNYEKLQKRFSNNVGAILTQNQIRISSDGDRFIAFGQPHKQHLYLLDLDLFTALKINLVGEEIEQRSASENRPKSVPDFATKNIYEEIAFDFDGNVVVLLPNSIVEINAKSPSYDQRSFAFSSYGNTRTFGGFDQLTASNDRFYLLASHEAKLSILKKIPESR